VPSETPAIRAISFMLGILELTRAPAANRNQA
jgi:hypothetical protein